MIIIEYVPLKAKRKKWRVKCQCGTIFTCDETDLKRRCYGHGEFFNIVPCPQCGFHCLSPYGTDTYERID